MIFYLVPSAIIGTCDHCDLQEVQSLSAKLLDTLTDASLHENAGTSPSDIVSNSLKDEMLTFLGIGRITQSSSSTVTLNPLTIPSDFSIDLDPSLDFLALQNRLQRGSFVAHLQSKKSAWGKVNDYFPIPYDILGSINIFLGWFCRKVSSSRRSTR